MLLYRFLSICHAEVICTLDTSIECPIDQECILSSSITQIGKGICSIPDQPCSGCEKGEICQYHGDSSQCGQDLCIGFTECDDIVGSRCFTFESGPKCVTPDCSELVGGCESADGGICHFTDDIGLNATCTYTECDGGCEQTDTNHFSALDDSKEVAKVYSFRIKTSVSINDNDAWVTTGNKTLFGSILDAVDSFFKNSCPISDLNTAYWYLNPGPIIPRHPNDEDMGLNVIKSVIFSIASTDFEKCALGFGGMMQYLIENYWKTQYNIVNERFPDFNYITAIQLSPVSVTVPTQCYMNKPIQCGTKITQADGELDCTALQCYLGTTCRTYKDCPSLSYSCTDGKCAVAEYSNTSYTMNIMSLSSSSSLGLIATFICTIIMVGIIY